MQNRNYDLRVDISYEVPEFFPSDGKIRPSRFKALLLYLIVAVGLLVSSVITAVFQWIWPDMSVWGMQTLTSFIYYPLMCVLPVILLLRGRKGCVHVLRPNPVRGRTVLLSVALAVMGVLFANNLNVLWALPFDAAGFDIYVASAPAPETVGQLLLAVLTVGVMPGACEELVFRGFMQPAFEEKGSKRAAIFVSLLFALLHGSVVGFPVQFLLGVIMAAIIIITDSIYASAIFHTVYNSALMMLLFVQNRMGMADSVPGQLFNDIGGMVGVLSASFGVAQMGAGIFFILFAMYRKAKKGGLQLTPKQPLRLRGGEIGILCAGLGFVALYYITDILAMAGVLV